MLPVPERKRSPKREHLYEIKEYAQLRQRLAKNLRALRKKRKMTQQRAAELTELSYGHYLSLEHEQTNVTFVTLAKLVRGLEVDVTRLLRA